MVVRRSSSSMGPGSFHPTFVTGAGSRAESSVLSSPIVDWTKIGIVVEAQ
jgi:hypothetical protein